MAIAIMFGAFTPKAQASVSWGQEVTAVGNLYIKSPYKWGGKTPKGFDASGYTQYVFKKSAAKINLPASSKNQFKVGKAVKQKDLQEGDLVFFKTNGKDVSFVGIYLSKGQFLAVTVSKGVSVQNMSSKYWKDKYAGAKRVLPKY
ncbi:NlpC/P60 family protein [Peribacillus deserti]|uniref:NlpC/P60 family protein n=2 Tax=Peribacillus deserti TaxID=673318 RepID=A0A2N5M6J4_9BACI|nr:NlpC/P60 family protein [Peribacillus deserti]